MQVEFEELEAEIFYRDYVELQLSRETPLIAVLDGLSGLTSYKFSLLGSTALIAVDGIGPRQAFLASVPVRRPRVLSVRWPS